MTSILPTAFFARDVLDVARDLLGCRVTHAGVTVRLTEVEAYAGAADPGSHAFRGRSPRTEVMFGRPGRLYVYFTYGMHWCANVVTGHEGAASAVLLRAGEVVAGHDLAAQRRPGVRPRDQARGPARLATTLGLGRAQNGLALVGARAAGRVEPPETPVDPAVVRTGPRVGVSGAGGDGEVFPWRFWLDGEPSVSAYRPGRPRNRHRGGDVAAP
ncbi:DNA-3-methyladenine glycosylase [Oryzobacter sp. R7]|uniref:DNA-3-methyladenine glycosylase n=1 Tax=Oryzobacter faecalis TaxID=3388656 RepID=UPI00398CC65D